MKTWIYEEIDRFGHWCEVCRFRAPTHTAATSLMSDYARGGLLAWRVRGA